MRAVVASALAALLVVMASAPHVHTGPKGDHDCPACVARTTDAARRVMPDLTPSLVEQPSEAEEPLSFLRAGPPLGAIPGQSPPVSA